MASSVNANEATLVMGPKSGHSGSMYNEGLLYNRIHFYISTYIAFLFLNTQIRRERNYKQKKDLIIGSRGDGKRNLMT